MIRRLLGPAAAALVLSAMITTAGWAGPPWISIEYPSNPHDVSTRGAFFTLHTYHHAIPMQFKPSGTAEGLVNGRRQSLPLEITEGSLPGTYAVKFTPAREGAWVLAINAGNGNDGFGIMVTLNRQGGIAAVRVPSRTMENGRWTIPMVVTPQDVEAALRAQVAMTESREDSSSSLPLAAAALALVVGLPLLRWREN